MGYSAFVRPGLLKDLALAFGLCSHLLAWAAFIVLVFIPFYQGEAVTATSPVANVDGPTASQPVPNQRVNSTATLFQVNGWSVLPIVLAPVLVSAIGLTGGLLSGPGRMLRRISLAIGALLLLGFCVAGSFSIGLFYLPAALAMTVAAVIGLIQRTAAPGNA